MTGTVRPEDVDESPPEAAETSPPTDPVSRPSTVS